MKKSFTKKMSRKAHKVGLTIKKYSPEILAVVGVTSVVAGTVLACKATTKASVIMEESKKEISTIHAAAEMKNIPMYNEETKKEEVVVYTDEDKKKDLTIVYAQTGVKLVKNYAPSVLLIGLGLGALLTSNNILRKRYVASAAAYAAVDKGFKDYRKRVVERFGKDLDHELRYNIKAKEVEEVVTDENGNEKVEKKIVDVMDIPNPDLYARFYDAGCNGYTKDPEANLNFLRMQQKFANDKLESQGYLFLNDVYEMLGLPKTKAGQIVGWIYDEDCPIGDNFVDFGIYNGESEACRRFVNGYETAILLDFNPDGNILDKFWMLGLDKFGTGNF